MLYTNMFVLSPIRIYESADYQAIGMKAKKKCLFSGDWKDLELGDRVKLFFDDKTRVAMAALISIFPDIHLSRTPKIEGGEDILHPLSLRKTHTYNRSLETVLL